ncbi:hypothetical protein [Acinetobacter phage P577]|uniref:hypothetical protein n=1 Tax=Acinetobacter phage YMC13/03/R2096 TaxID=1560342 RepID=UPI00052A768F|nr:hypothetical protein ACQ36_gp075 [Acinetobacter phage YMC13/03/R2096]AIW02858.1 hypothetical protein BPABA577_01240 [Acinetobacter phage YMC13/03/R2096]WNT46182.1 hypothetical protein [Acinetobacter phage P577]
MAKYKEGDKVVVTKLVSTDYERGIRVGHIAKVVTVRDLDGAAYCHNPEWDYRGLQRQNRTMLSYQIEKCEVHK